MYYPKSIKQVMWIRDQKYIFITDPRNKYSPDFNKYRGEYDYYNNIVIEYENRVKERRVKIAAIAVPVVGGLAAIGINAKIANSDIGPRYSASQKGLIGSITQGFFKAVR